MLSKNILIKFFIFTHSIMIDTYKSMINSTNFWINNEPLATRWQR